MRSLSSLPISLLFAIYMQSALAAEQQKCYGMDGIQLVGSFAPCNTTAKHSGCCNTNPSGGSPDLCMSNGLCMATNNEYMGTIWQAACTDSPGKDTGCPKTCPDSTYRPFTPHSQSETGQVQKPQPKGKKKATNSLPSVTLDGRKVSSWNIQTCDYGSYCCREADDRDSCCDDPDAPKITTNTIGTLQPVIPSPPPSASNATAISSPTPTPTPTPSSSSSERLEAAMSMSSVPLVTSTMTAKPNLSTLCSAEKRKTGNIVGGAVGGIMGAAMLGLLVFVLWMHRKEKRQRVLKEHYEEQFRNSAKALSSSGRVEVVVADREDVLLSDDDAPVKKDGKSATSTVRAK